MFVNKGPEQIKMMISKVEFAFFGFVFGHWSLVIGQKNLCPLKTINQVPSICQLSTVYSPLTKDKGPRTND